MTAAAESSTQALARLQQETVAVSALLHELQEQIAVAESRLAGDKAAQLIEVNAALVTAALRAQAEAESATEALRASAHTAETDALTGLPNRVLFADRLNHAIAAARRDGTRLALLFVDLDGLKQINDEFGHSAGDRVLQHAGHALQFAVRESDTVSRHGGDEFLVLLPSIGSEAEAAAVAHKLQLAMAQPCRVGGYAISTSASVGISIFPGCGTSAGELVGHADEAMYRAKRQRRGSIEFHGAPPAAGPATPAEPSHAGRLAAAARTAEEQLIRDTNERLLLNALQQTDFMAMVAHEFRNPLASISNAATLLQHARADSAVVERLGPLLSRQVSQLSRLAGDLMAATTTGGDHFQLELHLFDLTTLIEGAAESCRPGLQARRQSLVPAYDGGPWMVRADPVRIAQVLRNLLDNASKYTPEGGHVSVSLAARGDRIEVTVADDGIGLQAASLDSVFGLFTQEDKTPRPGTAGLGIGLAVARQLVEAHGGRIEARSAGLGLGCEFVFSLPRAG